MTSIFLRDLGFIVLAQINVRTIMFSENDIWLIFTSYFMKATKHLLKYVYCLIII